MILVSTLGVPLIHKRVSRKKTNYIMKKVQQRLAGWKAKWIYLAGRTSLYHPMLVEVWRWFSQWLKNNCFSCLVLLLRTQLGRLLLDDVILVHRFHWDGFGPLRIERIGRQTIQKDRQKKRETLHRNKGLRARGYGHGGYGKTYDRLGRIRTGRK